jgi:hypothetical protein
MGRVKGFVRVGVGLIVIGGLKGGMGGRGKGLGSPGLGWLGEGWGRVGEWRLFGR